MLKRLSAATAAPGRPGNQTEANEAGQRLTDCRLPAFILSTSPLIPHNRSEPRKHALADISSGESFVRLCAKGGKLKSRFALKLTQLAVHRRTHVEGHFSVV